MSAPMIEFDWPHPAAGPLVEQTRALIDEMRARDGWTQLHQTRATALMLTAERTETAYGYKFPPTMAIWQQQLAELEATPFDVDESGDVEYQVVLLPAVEQRALPHAS